MTSAGRGGTYTLGTKGTMAEAQQHGVFGAVPAILQSAAAGFAFGEAALFAVDPALTDDATLLSVAYSAARQAGSSGVGVVAACLVFTTVLISLGNGFLFASVVMTLLTKVRARLPWLAEALTGASAVVGAVTTGVLAGILPPWTYLALQGALVLTVYSYSNINDMTTALLIIFTTLYFSIVYGRMGIMTGSIGMILTICFLYLLRRVLTKNVAQRPTSKKGCRLLERIFFYSVFVGILGFSVGLVAGELGEETEAEVVLMLQSVVWVGYLSAALLGAGLGTVAMVGLGPYGAGKVALGATVLLSVALSVFLHSGSSLGPRGCLGAILGAATAAGMSLGAASVSAKQAFTSRNSALVVFTSVAFGTVLAFRWVPLIATSPTTSELITITLVGVGAFVLGAPQSPFHTQVNLQRGLVTGPELMQEIGMETVTAAAAPIGAGALGTAAMGTAALGKLGTVGVVMTLMLALGSTLGSKMRKPPTAHAHSE